MGVIFASFMVPCYTNIVSLYQIALDFGLIDTYWGVILPVVVSLLGVFLLHQSFKGIPAEYEEAARFDGSTTFQVCTRITLPLAKPILSTLVPLMLVYN